MRGYTTDEMATAQALVDSADREFGDYSRTDLLLDNMQSLRNVEDAHRLLVAIGVSLRPTAVATETTTGDTEVQQWR